PVYKLAKHIFSPRVAAISVLILITNYFVIFQNFRLLPEVFFSGTILWLLFNLLKIEAFQLKRFAVSSGILFGISGLLRGVILCFFPVALLWISTRRQIEPKKRLIFIILVTASTALTLSPWTIRNYVVFKSFVPIDTSFGENFWVGNNERATGSLAATTGESIGWPTEDLKIQMEGMNEAEKSHFLTRVALDFIRKNPRDFLILRLKAFFYFWFTYNFLSYPPVFYLEFDRILFEFSNYYLVFFNLLLFVGAYAAIIRKRNIFLIGGVAGAFSVVYSLFHAIGTLRYCSPLHPVLGLFVAYALYEIYLMIPPKWRRFGRPQFGDQHPVA
ncbi:MAG: glycosyltransferase family 39 protein, partial [Candidatus Hydrogenedentota bacterium]